MKIFKLITVFSLATILITACASATTPTTTTDGTGVTSPAQAGGQVLQGTAAIEMNGFAFSPDKVTVKVGTTVTWTNQDPAGHDVAASDGSFRSGILNQGETFSFQFNQPGTYAYGCTIHPSMQGEITVVQ